MNGAHEYTVKEASTENVFDTVIEKSNITAEFTPREMFMEQARCEKVIKELDAKLDIEQKTIANIEHYHPYVKDFTLEQLYAFHMYYESRALVESIPDKVQEMREQLAASKEEMAVIADRLGLDLSPKTPEQAVDAAVEKIVGPQGFRCPTDGTTWGGADCPTVCPECGTEGEQGIPVAPVAEPEEEKPEEGGQPVAA